MPVTFLHTADWQLGKPFQRVADDAKRARLQNERLASLRRIGEVVRERRAAFVVVAGDVFDSPSPLNSTVAAACEAIGAMKVPVLVIPGNHGTAVREVCGSSRFLSANARSGHPTSRCC